MNPISLHPYPAHKRFLQLLNGLLVFFLFVKIAGFFTWSENIAITRVVKVFTRTTMTAAIWWLHYYIVQQGAVASYKWQNALAFLLYGAYLALGLVSLLWSTNIGYSALQWFMDFESLVFAFYFIQCFILIDNFFPKAGIKFYNVLGNAVFLMMLIFVVGMFVAPDVFYRLTHGGEEARLGGFFMNPNELGMLCVVGISCFIFDIYRNHKRTATVLKTAVLLFALVMTGSRSSTIGCLLVFFFHIKQSDNVKLKVLMYAAAFMAIPLAIDKIMIKEGGGGLDEVLSMTGRLPFWKALITEGLPQEPYFGFGFMRIAYKDYFQSVHTYAGQMTHNTFIQVLMNLGFVGFTIVLFQMVFTIRGFLQTEQKEKRLMLIGILIPVLINSFTEFGIFGETNYGILFYQLLIFYISRTVNMHLTPSEKLHIKKRRPHLQLS